MCLSECVFIENLFTVSKSPHAISNYPVSEKYSDFYAHLNHSVKLCSDSTFFKEDFNYFKNISMETGLSSTVINNTVEKETV